ncbi:deubiquitinase OTUD6B-like [Penaeus monodon]|uniref:deubiquitinase OTUD6B-like n=1 Tax=Penaeus monodon TaxID=6687 RepID=UPI0018A7BBDA|nr:deubiquitinase OTUD6B-like [Penaeus monodon]
MDDDSGTEELTTEEVLLAQHRKEKKELRAKIQQIKKNNKDKKNKKEGAEQIARLEEELTQRHVKELEELKNSTEQRINPRAEKRRQKKAKANREREARIKEERSNLKFSARNIEAEKMKKILQEPNPCFSLYHEEFQLRSKSSSFSPVSPVYQYLSSFLIPQLIFLLFFYIFIFQLRALSQAMKRRIEVLQAEGAPIIFGEECDKDRSILLAYYRHYYGLGGIKFPFEIGAGK